MNTVTIEPPNKSLPGRIEAFLRVGGTVKLVNSLMRDTRVSMVRKVSFAVALCLLLTAMIFPELVADGFLATILPFISSLIGIPIEAGVDWFTFILLLPVLLRIFPAPIMQEHYLRIFKNKKALADAGSYTATVIPSPGQAGS